MGAQLTNAPIARVTVHTNGALVVRRMRAEPGTIEVLDLPLLYSSDSLRVRATGGAVRDVEETCSLVATERPEPPDDEELERLAHDDARLRDRLASLQALARAWEAMLPGEPGERPPEGLPDAAPWLAAYDTAGERLAVVEEEIARVQRERNDKARARRRLQRSTQGDVAPPRFVRGLRFVVDAAQACDVELEYFVAGARWVPTYNLDLAGGRGSLTLSALIAQATGEDWSDAELRLSTADLTRESTLPELTSWRIGRAQAARRPAFRPLPDDLPGLFTGWERDRSRTGAGGGSPPGGPSGAVRGPSAPRAPRAPKPASAPEPVGGGFEDERTAEWDVDRAGAYPEQAPAEDLLEMEDDADFDGDTGHLMMADLSSSASVEVEMSAPMASRAMAPPEPPAAAPASRSRRSAPSKKRAKQREEMDLNMGGGGGGFGSGEGMSVPQGAEEPLPPRLRYAYLRVAGADESGRGTLRAVDPLEHLYSLVDDHDSASLADLRRAADALRIATMRVTGRRAPGGARAPDGASFHHVFAADGRHDVPTDGSWHRVVVERNDADARTDYRCVPREADDVYRFCTLLAASGAPLLPGPLHVYEDGAFRVTSRVDASAGGAQLELNLGAEPALRIDGRTVNIDQQEKGLVSQTSRVQHRIAVQLRSALTERAHVIVYDRLPVTEKDDKDIEVKLTEATPKAVVDDRDTKGDPLRGGIHFEIDLEPGAVSDVKYAYEITLPAKAELVGGNRRE
jgi:hypothetical protein